MKWTVALMTMTVLSLVGCKTEPPARAPEARPAKLYTVVPPDALPPRRYPAVVEATEKPELSFRIGGTITEINVKPGQEVKKGEVIARLDPRDYELALNRANSQLEETQAQERAMKAGARPEDIRILENKVAAARTQFERDERFFRQREGLVERGAISREELQTAEAAFRVSRETLETAERELEKGRTGSRKEDIEAIEARVRDLQENVRNAKNALNDTELRAPYVARVVEKFVEVHQEVQPRQAIVNLQQLDEIKLSFDLPESVVFNLQRGNVGTFSAVFREQPNKEYPVTLNEFRLSADPKTRTFTCWVIMVPPQDVIVLPGMTAEIIHHNPRASQPGFPVPIGAIFADESKAYFVWKVEPTDMTVHKMPVEVGTLTGNDAWVLKGLNAGELIVAAGANYLQDGQTVYRLESKE
jgi:multidrug efflux system membrane fusion protein